METTNWGSAPEITQQREIAEAGRDRAGELVPREAELRQRSEIAEAGGNRSHQLVSSQKQPPGYFDSI